MRNRVYALLDYIHLAFIAEHLFYLSSKSLQGCEGAWLCWYADQMLIPAYTNELFPLAGNSPVAIHTTNFIESYSQMLALTKLLGFLIIKTRFGIFYSYLKYLCFLNPARTVP